MRQFDHSSEPYFHQEDYALALERMVIQDCMTDPRPLANKSLEPGGRNQTPSIGYPLYTWLSKYALMYMYIGIYVESRIFTNTSIYPAIIKICCSVHAYCPYMWQIC